MSKYIDADLLRKEIERRYNKHSHSTAITEMVYAEEDEAILSFIDSLPEQPALPGFDEEGIPGRDFIPVEWVDACEQYGKWKIVRAEQPVDGLDLEKEIDDYIKGCLGGLKGREIASCARYFYELGQQSRPKISYNPFELEQEILSYIKGMGFGYGGWVDGLEDEDLCKLARHFAEWGVEHLKK